MKKNETKKALEPDKIAKKKKMESDGPLYFVWTAGDLDRITRRIESLKEINQGISKIFRKKKKTCEKLIKSKEN